MRRIFLMSTAEMYRMNDWANSGLGMIFGRIRKATGNTQIILSALFILFFSVTAPGQNIYHIDSYDRSLMIVSPSELAIPKSFCFGFAREKPAIYVVHDQYRYSEMEDDAKHTNTIYSIAEQTPDGRQIQQDCSAREPHMHRRLRPKEKYCASTHCYASAIGNDSSVFVNSELLLSHFRHNDARKIKIRTFVKNSRFDIPVDSFYVPYDSSDTGITNAYFNYLASNIDAYDGYMIHRYIDYDKIPCSVDLEISVENNLGEKVLFRITEITTMPIKIMGYNKILRDLYAYTINGKKMININRVILDKSLQLQQ